MKQPLQKDEEFLADVAAHRDGPSLWWLGQSGFLFFDRGHGFLFDPYLSDSLTAKYAATEKPHVRITERVVAPARLTGIVAVTSSHNHTDHLDAETLIPLRRANPGIRLLAPEVNRDFIAARLSSDSAWHIGLAAGETVNVGPFQITGIQSAHEHIAPEFLGFVLESGGITVYHPGDCVLYPGLEETLAPFDIDVALLPINGSLPARRVSGNFWGREAAALAKAIGAKLAVPMHYDMFEFNTVTSGEFVSECRRLGQPFRVLENGERLDLPRH